MAPMFALICVRCVRFRCVKTALDRLKKQSKKADHEHQQYKDQPDDTAPIFLASVELSNGAVMKPSIEEIQQSLVKVADNVVHVSQAVMKWKLQDRELLVKSKPSASNGGNTTASNVDFPEGRQGATSPGIIRSASLVLF
jgi:hypothetical protein